MKPQGGLSLLACLITALCCLSGLVPGALALRQGQARRRLLEGGAALYYEGAVVPPTTPDDLRGYIELPGRLPPGQTVASAPANLQPSLDACVGSCREPEGCNIAYWCSLESGCPSQLLNATVPHGGCGLVWQAASALETGRPPETVAAAGFSTVALIQFTPPRVHGFAFEAGIGFPGSYDYGCLASLDETNQTCQRQGTPQALAPECAADPLCRGMAYYPATYWGFPITIFKGGPGVVVLNITQSTLNHNSAVYFRLEPPPPGTVPQPAAAQSSDSSSSSSSSASLGAGAIAGIAAGASCALVLAAAAGWVLSARRQRQPQRQRLEDVESQQSSQKVPSEDAAPTSSGSSAGRTTPTQEHAPSSHGGQAACHRSSHSGGQHSGGQHSGGQHSGGQHSGGQHYGGHSTAAGPTANLSRTSSGGSHHPTIDLRKGGRPPRPVNDATFRAYADPLNDSAEDPAALLLGLSAPFHPPALPALERSRSQGMLGPISPFLSSEDRSISFPMARAGSWGRATRPSAPHSTLERLPSGRPLELDGLLGPCQAARATSLPPGSSPKTPVGPGGTGAPLAVRTQLVSRGSVEPDALNLSIGSPAGSTTSDLLISRIASYGLPATTEEHCPTGASDVVEFSDIHFCRNPDGSLVQLGSGAFSTVYRVLLDGVQPHAAKCLVLGDDPKLAEEFVQEAGTLRQLRHRNIVSYSGVCVHQGRGIILMELMDGRDLHSRLNILNKSGERTFAWHNRGRTVALDVARALHYLHSRNLTHFDLKSQNCLLSRDFTAKLADVGFTKSLRATHHSLTDGRTGTFDYMAPELLLGKPCTQAIDCFSFGVLLWELCRGEYPTRGRLCPLRVPQDCPQEIADLYLDCVEQDPARRPTAKQLVQRLTRAPARAGQPGLSALPPSPYASQPSFAPPCETVGAWRAGSPHASPPHSGGTGHSGAQPGTPPHSSGGSNTTRSQHASGGSKGSASAALQRGLPQGGASWAGRGFHQASPVWGSQTGGTGGSAASGSFSNSIPSRDQAGPNLTTGPVAPSQAEEPGGSHRASPAHSLAATTLSLSPSFGAPLATPVAQPHATMPRSSETAPPASLSSQPDASRASSSGVGGAAAGGPLLSPAGRMPGLPLPPSPFS